MDKNNIIGERFGRYVVVSFAHKNNSRPFYNCLCDCGNSKEVNYYNLKNGLTKSCGCLRSDTQRNIKKHGLSRTRFYTIFAMIKQRCFNEKTEYYKNYGGRGIKCYWDTMEEFKADMYDSYLEHVKMYGEKDTTIERKDNNKGYFKDNCEWATRKEQSHNKRNTKIVLFNGEKKPLVQVAKIISDRTGIRAETIRDRILKGKAVDAPLYSTKKRKYDLLGFVSWKEFSAHVGISKQRIFQLMEKGLTTQDIIKRYEKNTTNQELS